MMAGNITKKLQNLKFLKQNPFVFPSTTTLYSRFTRASCKHNTNISTISTTTSNLYHQPYDRLLVIGSGVAGCATALIAAETYKILVTVVHAGALPTDCNSFWAQGGIIYRNYDPSSNDSASSLISDIHRAGAGLSEDNAAWKVANEGPWRVRQLLLGLGGHDKFPTVSFDTHEDGSLKCCLEASHSAARIVHHADKTGAVITDYLTAAVASHPNITMISHAIVTDLLVDHEVCVGAHVMDTLRNRTYTLRASRGTVMATGGLGGIYCRSTNPPGYNALGSSVALAMRVGNVSTSDLEYVQFHPTALCLPGEEGRFLLTEALRGEGAILRDANGREFARDFHIDGELAPRDIVARGVYAELQKGQRQKQDRKGSEEAATHNAFLDITHRESEWLRNRFPSIDAHLTQRGWDLTKDALPVTPSAHYTCGGVMTDGHGRTSMMNLYAAGEAARTGLHGGNRLASTSLLEGLVYGASVADHVGKSKEGRELASERLAVSVYNNVNGNDWDIYSFTDKGKERLGPRALDVERATQLLSILKHVMWDHVGVIRTPVGLERALMHIGNIQEESDNLFENSPCAETLGLRDAVHSGGAVAKAALRNTMSTGAHCIVVDSSTCDDCDNIMEEEEVKQVAIL